MRASDALIMASGTATLEAALIDTPMVVAYRVSAVNYWLGRLLIKGIDSISLCNIVARKKIVPEFIQHQATPEYLFAATRHYLDDKAYYEQVVDQLNQIQEKLYGPSARNIGELVLSMLKDK